MMQAALKPGETPAAEPTVRQIQKAVGDYYGVTIERLLATSRHPRDVMARKVAMYLARHAGMMTYPEIGRAFHRDHTTAITAVRAVEADPALMQRAQFIRDVLEGRAPQVLDFCPHCGQRVDRERAIDELKVEQERISRRIAALEASR